MRAHVALQSSAHERLTTRKTERSYARRLSCRSTCSTPTLEISRRTLRRRRTCSTRSRRRARASARVRTTVDGQGTGPGGQCSPSALATARDRIRRRGVRVGSQVSVRMTLQVSHNMTVRVSARMAVLVSIRIAVPRHPAELSIAVQSLRTLSIAVHLHFPGAVETFHDGPSAFSSAVNTFHGGPFPVPNTAGLFPGCPLPIFGVADIFPRARCAGRSTRPRLSAPPIRGGGSQNSRRRWTCSPASPAVRARRSSRPLVSPPSPALHRALRLPVRPARGAPLLDRVGSAESGLPSRVCWRTQGQQTSFGIFPGRPAACPGFPRFSPACRRSSELAATPGISARLTPDIFCPP